MNEWMKEGKDEIVEHMNKFTSLRRKNGGITGEDMEEQ